MKHVYSVEPDKQHAAVCGLFCPSCTYFIATKEDQDKLKEKAETYKRPIEDLKCCGCRSDTLFFYCKENCVMKKCAAGKGIDFCIECSEYPCGALKEFKAAKPHRIELWESLSRIKNVGYEKWYAEMMEHYSCPECGAINSAYDLECRKCGAKPSCEYVRLYEDEIILHIKKAKENA